MGTLKDFAVHTHHAPQHQISQNLVDGCQLIGIEQIAERIHRAVSTVRTQVSREPEKLPPRFLIHGSNQVVWMLRVVIDWMIQQQASSILPSSPLKKKGGKRRGAPTATEKLAARNAGVSVSEFRATQARPVR